MSDSPGSPSDADASDLHEYLLSTLPWEC